MRCLNCNNEVFQGSFCEECRDENHIECAKQIRETILSVVESEYKWDDSIQQWVPKKPQ